MVGHSRYHLLKAIYVPSAIWNTSRNISDKAIIISTAVDDDTEVDNLSRSPNSHNARGRKAQVQTPKPVPEATTSCIVLPGADC